MVVVNRQLVSGTEDDSSHLAEVELKQKRLRYAVLPPRDEKILDQQRCMFACA